jgi:Helix-turn-helix domain
MPAGRPTDYTPELGQLILGLMADGLSLAAAAAECGVHRQRVYDWAERYPEFSDIVKLAMAKRQLFLERKLLGAKDGPSATAAIFALKNAARADWRDIKAVEHTGAEGGPIRSEHVDYSNAPDDVIRWLAQQRPTDEQAYN